jgi:hypothetical protein
MTTTLAAPTAFDSLLARASEYAGLHIIADITPYGQTALLRFGKRSADLRWVADDGGTTYIRISEATPRRYHAGTFDATLYEMTFSGNASPAALLAYLIAELSEGI